MGDKLENDSQQDIIQRLKRIEGQARGLQRMLEEGRDCKDIMIQITAIRSAIDHVSMAVLGAHMAECFANEIRETGDCVEAINQLKDMFMKLS
jgi:DNA-binding FrmR family transcriptional regulator